MPLPLILGGIAAIAAAGGIAGTATGTSKMVKANRTMKSAQERHEKNLQSLEEQNKATCADMDALGMEELEILNSFESFFSLYEKIMCGQEFRSNETDEVEIPAYDGETLKKVSVGAGVLLATLGGATLGTAGGIAAAGAATSVVMALGTASSGTAIASLSGVAATNATLAALGGGAIAAGGGGVALGTTVLGATTAGIGILVSGVVLGIAGKKLSAKADEAWEQMLEAELKIWKTNDYLKQLSMLARTYRESLQSVRKAYECELNDMKTLVEIEGRTDYAGFDIEQRKNVKTAKRLVEFLTRMCQLPFISDCEDENGFKTVNTDQIKDMIDTAERFLAYDEDIVVV